jgi:hypothetical protein
MFRVTYVDGNVMFRLGMWMGLSCSVYICGCECHVQVRHVDGIVVFRLRMWMGMSCSG